MGGLLAAIATLAAPMAARVIIALGFSVVTLAGAEAVISQLKGLMLSSIGAGESVGIQIAGIAGVWEALGAVFGAITFTVTLFALTKAVRIAGSA